MCYPCPRTVLLPLSPDRTVRLHNTRLHLTAPRGLFQMQPAVNECSAVGIATAQLIARVPGGSASFTTG